jgi:dTDP-4-amino-4,6-dideoxygalactose transaminase
MNVKFNIPTKLSHKKNIWKDLLDSNSFSSGGAYDVLCKKKLKEIFDSEKSKIYLTPSCSQSLEASSIIFDIKAGDEIIMPSYTYVTSATSFSNRGVKIKFVDIRPDTLNIDEALIENALTKKTKAILPVHYAGVSCEMDKISKIAKENNLIVIEDAAQAMGSFYKGRHCGTLGDAGTFSYHDTKNLHCGEGGSLVINNPNYFNLSDCVVEKGTNRKKFLNGLVDKYTWVTSGSSYAMSQFCSVYLLEQLKQIDRVTKNRLNAWNYYYTCLSEMQTDNFLIPSVPNHCKHNGHVFYIILETKKVRDQLMNTLRSQGVASAFHFSPLHSAPAGKSKGFFVGEDKWTTKIANTMLRLPLYESISKNEIDYVVEKIRGYFNE